MKALNKLYHFFGSVKFAIILIATVAMLAITGTFLESVTSSHRYAAYFTYQNPLFIVLLWGFFINILFAALRRYPFKIRHIPFLITHLGLLMILSGNLVKGYQGVQGNMSITEGTASQEIFLPDTYVLAVESKSTSEPQTFEDKIISHHFSLQRNWKGDFIPNLKEPESNFRNLLQPTSSSDPFPSLEIELLEYKPHSQDRLELWVKGDYAHIAGLKPFQVHEWEPSQIPQTASEGPTHSNQTHTLPISSRARVTPAPSKPWDFYAFRTSKVEALAKELYIQGLLINIIDPLTQEVIISLPLSQVLQKPFIFLDGVAMAILDFDYSPLIGLTSSSLAIHFFKDTEQIQETIPPHETIVMILNGPESLINHTLTTSYASTSLPWSVELSRSPSIAIVQDLHGDNYLFSFDPYGRIHDEAFRSDNLNSLVVYDRGFGGYAAQARIPFPATRNQLEKGQENNRQTQSRTADFGQDIILECPVSCMRKESPPSLKLEDNTPQITLKLTEKNTTELITLSYDRFAKGLKWPAMKGKYLMRFQPKFLTIPYRIRLRDARQINYPNSAQAYSYESDLIILDQKRNSTVEETICMNHVHETPEGYRFYLANISPPIETATQSIQIIVNYDPAKYFLTYPGALILALGIFLLFWLKPYKKNKI